jgi:hypothetical protein
MAMQTLGAVSIVAAMTVSSSAATPDWKEALERSFETTIYRTSETAVLDGNRVTSEGTALVVKKTGILANPARYLGSVNTKIRNGAVIQPGGVSALFSSRDIAQFKVGDVVYLKEVQVRDDVIVLEILSREIVPILERRSTAQMRYKGELEFHFPKGYLKSASLEDLRRTFDEFLEPV